jgi:hypothetical protein
MPCTRNFGNDRSLLYRTKKIQDNGNLSKRAGYALNKSTNLKRSSPKLVQTAVVAMKWWCKFKYHILEAKQEQNLHKVVSKS